MSSRQAALAGLALYATCRTRARWMQRAAWVGVKLFGPGILPGRSFAWNPPIDEETWLTLAERWRQVVGPFDSLAGYQRLQASRSGLGLLLIRGGIAAAFVKLRQGNEKSLGNTVSALELLAHFSPQTFRAPELLLSGSLHGWEYVVTAPLEPGLHQAPSDPPLSAITEEVAACLAGLPRPEGTLAHWRPMHGDFAPWNLRRTSGASLCLIDWEDASWAPPHADEVFYRAAEAALAGRSVEAGPDVAEAVRFWRERTDRPASNYRDRRLRAALISALDRMETPTVVTSWR